LANSIVQKVEQTGQSKLKTPVENQEVVQNALNVLGLCLRDLGRNKPQKS
jgi:hypothetical protein